MNNFIQDWLFPDEQIVWSGKPSKKRILNKVTLKGAGFFVLYDGLMILILIFLFNLIKGFHIIMLLPAFFFFLGFFVANYTIALIRFERNDIYYYLTNKRLIIFADLENTTVNKKHLVNYKPFDSFNLENIRLLHIQYSIFGTGNIYASDKFKNHKISFFNVDNPDNLRQLILKQENVDLYPDNTSTNRNTSLFCSADNILNPDDLLHSALKTDAAQKEKTIWSEHPKIRFLFLIIQTSPLIFTFCFFWNAGLMFIICFLIKNNPQIFMNVYISLGFIMLFAAGIFFTAIYIFPLRDKYKNLFYSVSNKKIVIKTNKISLSEYYWHDIKTLSVQINKNKYGNVYLNMPSKKAAHSKNNNNFNFDSLFYHIKNPVYVYKLLQQQMLKIHSSNQKAYQVHACDYENRRNGLKDLMLDNEKIIWSGKPNASFVLKKIIKIHDILFSMSWIALSAFMFFKAIAITGAFALWVLPYLIFLAGGVIVVFNKVQSILQLLNKTSYIITNKGISIYVDGFHLYYQSIWYPNLKRLEIKESKNGIGTIYFNNYLDSMPYSKKTNYMNNIKSNFCGIENVNYVYYIIKEQYEKYRSEINNEPDIDSELI